MASTSLRNSTLIKLSIILVTLTAYAVAAYCVNYHIHSFTANAAEFTSYLLKRNAYPSLINSLLRESIRSKNKDLLFSSPRTCTLP